MTQPKDLADAIDSVAAACSDADPAEWTPEDHDLILRSLNTVSYEVVGLAARIRAARTAMVNDTPVPHPVKPYTPPPPPPPKPQPQPKPPPPPPPSKDGA